MAFRGGPGVRYPAKSVCLEGKNLEIAAEMRVPLATMRKRLAELSATGEVVMCQLTRYEGSKTIEAWQYRVSGYVPTPAPRRKPKAA